MSKMVFMFFVYKRHLTIDERKAHSRLEVSERTSLAEQAYLLLSHTGLSALWSLQSRMTGENDYSGLSPSQTTKARPRSKARAREEETMAEPAQCEVQRPLNQSPTASLSSSHHLRVVVRKGHVCTQCYKPSRCSLRSAISPKATCLSPRFRKIQADIKNQHKQITNNNNAPFRFFFNNLFNYCSRLSIESCGNTVSVPKRSKVSTKTHIMSTRCAHSLARSLATTIGSIHSWPMLTKPLRVAHSPPVVDKWYDGIGKG